MRRLLLLALLAIPAASAEPGLALHVDPIPDEVEGTVPLGGYVEVPDGAIGNTWVLIEGGDAGAAFATVWRVDAEPPGMGGTMHRWETTWNTTAIPDGDHALSFSAYGPDDRTTGPVNVTVRTQNGNWARINGSEVMQTPGISTTRVDLRIHVESGFRPAAARVHMEGPDGAFTLIDVDIQTMAENGTMVSAIDISWLSMRPDPGAGSAAYVATLNLWRDAHRPSGAIIADGEVSFEVAPREDVPPAVQMGPQDPPPRNATLVREEHIVAKPALAAGLAAAVATAAILSTEAGRGGFLGLFSRLRSEEVLEHATRARLQALIAEHPGLRFKTIRQRLALPTGTLVHHLNVLEREGVVRRERDGGRLLFYGARSSTKGLELHPMAFRLWTALGRDSRVPLAVLARRWGLSRQAVHHHMRRLRRAGLVQAGGPPWRIDDRVALSWCRRCHWAGPADPCVRCGGAPA